MMQRFLLAILFPVLALAIIAVFAGSLGVVFMVLHHQMHSELGVIVLGMAFVLLVPLAAFLAQRAVEK